MPSLENNPDIPILWTVGQWKEFLNNYPDKMEIGFQDKYAGCPLHILCNKVSVKRYAGTTDSVPYEERLIFELDSPLHSSIQLKAATTRSEKKAKASRENGAKGGRPKTKK